MSFPDLEGLGKTHEIEQSLAAAYAGNEHGGVRRSGRRLMEDLGGSRDMEVADLSAGSLRSQSLV